mmetsp:Transcript_13187/g.32204  ORF Transcript_13187/g.32204 Transcript_13187/m.32204 type:complete len:223 (+) Transcript_13187:916-1584(+)
MKNNNVWNLKHCNRIVGKKEDQAKQESHLRHLATVKPCVDTAEPVRYVHLKYKTNTRELQRNRANEIQLENRILLQKMLEIDTRHVDLRQPVKAEKSLHAQLHTRESDRITRENRMLLKRLENCRGTLGDPASMCKQENKRQTLLTKMGANSNRYRRDIQLRIPPTPRGMPKPEGLPPWNPDKDMTQRFETFKRNYQKHMQDHVFISEDSGGGGSADAGKTV